MVLALVQTEQIPNLSRVFLSFSASVIPQEALASMDVQGIFSSDALVAAFEDLPDAYTNIRLQDPFYFAYVFPCPSQGPQARP